MSFEGGECPSKTGYCASFQHVHISSSNVPLLIDRTVPTVDNHSILYVIGSLEIGGSERHLSLIAPRLKQMGWQPVIYCLTHRGVLADKLRREDVEVIGPPFEAIGRSTPIRALSLMMSVCRLFGIMLRRRPRIAHFFLPTSYLIGGPLAVMTRVPVRVMSRRSLNLYQKNRPLLQKMEIRLHRAMHALLGNSKAVMRDLESEGCSLDRLHLIYNGVEDAPTTGGTTLTPEGAPKTEGLVLAIVANLIPYKAHEVLLRALATVASHMPASWTLLCIGRDTKYGVYLAQLAEELGLSDRVQFLGERHDVKALLLTTDIGILCSNEEGFANAILEGMAAGLPMIVTDVGGNAEAVVHGETGLVVPPGDPARLGAAILTLASDPASRHRMGSAARERQVALFSLDRCVSDYDRFYQALIER